MKPCRISVSGFALLIAAFTLSASPAPAASTWEWCYPYPSGGNVTAIEFVDANTGWIATEYIFTSNSSRELFRTLDGGATWTRLVDLGSSPVVRSLSFISPLEGWGCGDEGLICHTTDGGVSWTTQYSSVSADLLSIEFIDQDYGTAVGMNGTIIRTQDGGATWNDQGSETATVTDVSFVDVTNGWASVGGNSSNYVLHTSTAGAFWSMQPTGYSQNRTAIDFVDASHGWAANQFTPSIIKTADGGQTWTPALTQSVDHIHALEMLDLNTGVACGDAFIESMVAGNGWDVDTTSLANLNCLSLPSAGAAYCAGDFGLILKSTDLMDWASLSRITAGAVVAIDSPDDPSQVWACGEGGLILHSENGGASWELQDQPLAGIAELTDIRFVDGTTGYTCGRFGSGTGCILKTTDGGETWQSCTPPISVAGLNSIDFADSQNGAAVGNSGEILSTHDGGQSWSDVTLLSDHLYRIRFADDMTGFAVGDAGKMLHFDLATDSWAIQFSSTNYWLKGLFCLNSDTAWAAGWNGTVIRTYNAGANWYTVAMTGHDLQDVWFADANNGFFAGGLYYTTNGGTTLSEVPGSRDNGVTRFDFLDYYNGWGCSSGWECILKYGEAAEGVEDEGEASPSSGIPPTIAPNPFLSSTSVSFTVAGDEAAVRVEVYDMAGRIVARLVDSVLPGGEHTVCFDSGSLPAGVYEVRVDCAGTSSSSACVRLP